MLPNFFIIGAMKAGTTSLWQYLRRHPEYADLLVPTQKHWNAVLTGQETAKAALDAIAKEHEAILRKAGRLK